MSVRPPLENSCETRWLWMLQGLPRNGVCSRLHPASTAASLGCAALQNHLGFGFGFVYLISSPAPMPRAGMFENKENSHGVRGGPSRPLHAAALVTLPCVPGPEPEGMLLPPGASGDSDCHKDRRDWLTKSTFSGCSGFRHS